MSELKCCKLCGAFLTCDHKGECCAECEYFDPQDILCMAPEALKKAKNKEVAVNRFDDDEVDPQTFLFEDDDDAEEEADTTDTLDVEDEWG